MPEFLPWSTTQPHAPPGRVPGRPWPSAAPTCRRCSTASPRATTWPTTSCRSGQDRAWRRAVLEAVDAATRRARARPRGRHGTSSEPFAHAGAPSSPPTSRSACCGSASSAARRSPSWRPTRCGCRTRTALRRGHDLLRPAQRRGHARGADRDAPGHAAGRPPRGLRVLHADLGALPPVYTEYLIAALPRIASVVSSNPAAYVYLAESIRAWPDQAGARRTCSPRRAGATSRGATSRAGSSPCTGRSGDHLRGGAGRGRARSRAGRRSADVAVVLDAWAARSCPVKTQHGFDPRTPTPSRRHRGARRPAGPARRGGLSASRPWSLERLIDLARVGSPTSGAGRGRPRGAGRRHPAALADGVDVIVGGVLPLDRAGHRSGTPDLLVRGADAADGRPTYHPVLAVWHKVLTTVDARPARPRSGRSRADGPAALPWTSFERPSPVDLRHGAGPALRLRSRGARPPPARAPPPHARGRRLRRDHRLGRAGRAPTTTTRPDV